MKNVSGFLRQNSEIIDRVVNLVVFILIMTSIVFATQANTGGQINTFDEALYFVVSSLTTTGYGDYTISETTFGKLLSITIMVPLASRLGLRAHAVSHGACRIVLVALLHAYHRRIDPPAIFEVKASIALSL